MWRAFKSYEHLLIIWILMINHYYFFWITKKRSLTFCEFGFLSKSPFISATVACTSPFSFFRKWNTLSLSTLREEVEFIFCFVFDVSLSLFYNKKKLIVFLLSKGANSSMIDSSKIKDSKLFESIRRLPIQKAFKQNQKICLT